MFWSATAITLGGLQVVKLVGVQFKGALAEIGRHRSLVPQNIYETRDCSLPSVYLLSICCLDKTRHLPIIHGTGGDGEK